MLTDIDNLPALQINCPFCKEFASGILQDCDDASFSSRLLFQTDHFAVVPDISPLAPGHIMILPRAHVSSFGMLTPTLLTEINDLTARVKRTLARYYEPPVILEHGTNSFSAGGGCVSHAHLHFFPKAVDIRKALAPYNIVPIKNFKDLHKWASQDRSYVYFERENEERYVADQLHGIPRQFIRIEIARQIGLPSPQWNWRKHILLENLEATYKTLVKVDWS